MIDSTSSAGTSAAKSLPSDWSKPSAHRADRSIDQLSTERADHLRSTLANQPEVRPEMLEKGRALAADPSYPSLSVIQQVANQILNSPDLSEDQS